MNYLWAYTKCCTVHALTPGSVSFEETHPKSHALCEMKLNLIIRRIHCAIVSAIRLGFHLVVEKNIINAISLAGQTIL